MSTVRWRPNSFTIDAHTLSDVISERQPPRSLDRRSGLNGFSPKVSIQRELKGGDLMTVAYNGAVKPFILWDLLKMAFAAMTVAGLWAAFRKKA